MLYAVTRTGPKPLYWPQNPQSQELLLLYGTDEFSLQNQQFAVTDIFDLNTQNKKLLF